LVQDRFKQTGEINRAAVSHDLILLDFIVGTPISPIILLIGSTNVIFIQIAPLAAPF
jgi:hypothetical protein